jgi:uncharacterized SAM-binding protein YcdF (DUF218 family)
MAVSTAGLFFAWLVVAYTPFVSWLSADLPLEQEPSESDAIVVLSSRLQSDGDPTGVALNRLVGGVRLAGAGWAPVLVVTELPPPSASYQELALHMTDDFGLDVEVLALGPVSNTYDEARAVADHAGRAGWDRVLLVTSQVHSRRARQVFASQMPEVEVLSVPVPEARFDLENLDRSSERLRAFDAVMHEHLGAWVYRRRGWIAPEAP